MCGQYQVTDERDIEEINRILHELNQKYYNTDIKPTTGTVKPTDNAAVLSIISKKPQLSIMGWGFPNFNSKGVIVNSRSETVAEKTMFKKAFYEGRCIIPATGFYEWQKIDDKKPKTKYLFTCHGQEMLYMAAIHTIYKSEKNIDEKFVILTTDANKYISDIHNRMPVMLYKNELIRWLIDVSFSLNIMKRNDVVLDRRIV